MDPARGGTRSRHRLLRLYPAWWRARYEAEMLALLDERPVTGRDALDLMSGALDAHLHPAAASRLPALAAILAGAAWVVVALAWLAERVPPDWPGFLVWSLVPALVAALAGLVATLAMTLRIGDAPRRSERLVVIGLVVTHGLWIASLAAAVAGWTDVVLVAAAGSLSSLSTIAVGVVLLRRGEATVGLALVMIGGGLLLPPPTAWLVAAGGWTAIGLWELADRSVSRRAPIRP